MSVLIIGFGISSSEHMTLQALRLLKGCDVIFGPKGALPRSLPASAPDFRDIADAYRRDPDVERHIVAAVLAEAARGKTVGLCTAGHPLLFDSTVALLVAECKAKGIACQVVPGISSIDAILCDLGCIVDSGFQVLQAASLGEFRIDAGLPLLIFRSGALAKRPWILLSFITRLSKDYPMSHRVYLIESSRFPGERPRAESLDLRRLKKRIGSVSSEATLFIPPLRGPALRKAARGGRGGR